MTPRFHVETLGARVADATVFESVRDRVGSSGVYAGAGPEPLDPRAEVMIAWVGDQPRARCSTMTAVGLRDAPGLTGMIGHYDALDRASGISLLDHARVSLIERGAQRVIGPMNGSTWARYRLALPSDPGDPRFDPPTFTSEPRNPFDYPEHFAAAGFDAVSRYESRIDEAPGEEAPDGQTMAARVTSAGIRIRPFDLDCFDQELDVLFTMSLASFGANPFYAPLDGESFRRMYQAMRSIVDPDLVLIAEHDEDPVAFAFAFVDPASQVAGRPTRVIFKTIALLPAVRGRGLAALLFDRIRAAAAHKGCRAVIHALMHSSNASLRLSARHHTRLFRRYAVYQWKG